MSKAAAFINWTEEEFTGYWDGKSKTFQPGERKWMPDYLARHLAKHLTNRELLRTRPDGTLVHKDGDKMTSPKKPEEVPMFMNLFNKAYVPDTETDDEELGSKKDDIDALIDAANKNRGERIAKKGKGTKEVKEPKPAKAAKVGKTKERIDSDGNQEILSPDFDEEEDDEDSAG